MLIRLLSEEVANPTIGTERIIQSLLDIIFSQIIRKIVAATSTKPETWSHAIQDQQIAQALMAIEHGSQQGNVLVHCQHGSDRTGLVIAMYRIIYQHWPIEHAKQEMKQGGFGFHPIWVNIDGFFSPQHVQTISHLIAQRSALEPE
ncbi:MAG: hypothetical protein EOO68_33290 [Moraxellaceae bacterium]|nr:MAG: hypothetical protein EOO68_33290 [Moraxellaceae bacterium]